MVNDLAVGDYYLFMNKKGIYRIPHNAKVKLLFWGKHRHCLIEYNGERIRTMGNLLRKIKGDDLNSTPS